MYYPCFRCKDQYTLECDNICDYAKTVKENALIKEQLTKYRHGFYITEKETISINEWKNQHNIQVHKSSYAGAIGGRYAYEFIPTSIGTIGNVKCTCGEKFTFRDI